MDHEIIYEKGLRGKVTVSFNGGNKYAVTVDWKDESRPITKIKKGTKDVTSSRIPFIINLDQELEFYNDKIKITYFESIDKDSNINILSFNNNHKLYNYIVADQDCNKKMEMRLLTKDEDKYNELVSRRFNNTISNSIAILIKGITETGKNLTLEIIGGKIIVIK